MAATHVQTPFGYTTNASASSFAKAYASSVTAGNLLWAITWQYSTTSACTGVSDTTGGTWVQAGSTVTGGPSNSRIAVFYKKNTSGGASTATATWDATARGGIIIGEVGGLANGGDLDQIIGQAGTAASLGSIIAGTFATFAQSDGAVVAFHVASGNGTAASPLTADATPNSFEFEKSARNINSSTAGYDAKWTIVTATFAAVAVAFKDGSGGGGSIVGPGLMSSPLLSGRLLRGLVR